MAAIVASNFAVAAAPKVAVRKLSARKAVAVPGEFIFPPPTGERKRTFSFVVKSSHPIGPTAAEGYLFSCRVM